MYGILATTDGLVWPKCVSKNAGQSRVIASAVTTSTCGSLPTVSASAGSKSVSTSTVTTRPVSVTASASAEVRTPSPAPISKALPPGVSPPAPAIFASVLPSTRKFCPNRLRGCREWRFRSAETAAGLERFMVQISKSEEVNFTRWKSRPSDEREEILL